MAIIRCSKGHFYDNEKFSQCPHCGIFAAEDNDVTVAYADPKCGSPADDDMDKTVAISPYPEKEQIPQKAEKDDEKTLSAYEQEKGEDYLVGWLVCVRGADRGRDYRLHQGFNRLGRASHMDIQVTDPTVPRTAVSVVYDDRSNLFYAVQMESSAYLNGTYLEGAVQLKTGDLITTGSEEFEFIAFCREGRIWD